MKSLEELKQIIKNSLSEKRYLHVLSVVDEVRVLSNVFEIDDKEPLLHAALLHDCTKEWSFDKHLEYARENSHTLSESDLKSTPVLHARTGAIRALKEFGEDDRVFDIIFCHTTGKANMNLLEKILFIADFIEKGRSYTACIETRKAFYDDIEKCNTLKERLRALDRAVLSSLEFTVSYLQKKEMFVHPDTLCAIKYLGEI